MVRKLFASILNSTRCDGYIKIQQAEAIVALHDIFKQPTLFADHIHRYSLSVTRSISYGQRVMSHDDPIATKLSSVVANFSYAMTPGRFLVESMPILLRLPRFMNPWLALLERFRDEEDALSLENYRNALERGKKHPKQKTIVKDLQELRAGNESISEIQAATTCAEILQTGADTTANSLVILILACLAFPEVLAKAHEELDRVIGCDRFPTWEDEPNLPYIRAMIKEQHRWNTIAPMSFAHYTNAEDEYNGYRIPKGTVVRINTWAMHHDPERYPEPFRYNPDRFLDHKLSASAYANGSDVAARDHFSYGGGKRICVGMHLAERSLFTMASRLLQTFEIKPALDENGQEIPVDTSSSRFSSSLISVALPFQARFKVRNAAVEHLLEKEWIETAREGKVESWEGVL
ncbi:uncharacterized protein A1O9_12714 [Exophiala aquamarina CBS 119918]|uniref:Cytochrome P450 oxidoreductase n=1 Tax=Exophiala aquamarina CBS 119918 TaxID=1182545 RepID=A0A072NUB9_9EURO|nr:uncharacterized protein A1O9_12714 [Exophiala aquamarina CBS 119918]KEF51211.1 hypothetical protein A1O9_12714 [Exophiala aquamarina CBS 119918]